MEAKKSEKANLEKTKTVFLEAGLILALAVVILAFEWKTYDKTDDVVQVTQEVAQMEEMVIQTKQDEPEPPEQEVEQQQTTEFDIVDDDVELKNEFSIDNFSNTENGDIFVPQVEIKQEVDIEDDSERVIFTVVENSSEFPGGMAALSKFLSENLKYPPQAKETGTQGKVFVTFVVEKDGSITDVKVLRDIGSGCGEEAVRVVKMMPKWKPAKQRGKAVRQQFNLPVTFQLQ